MVTALLTPAVLAAQEAPVITLPEAMEAASSGHPAIETKIAARQAAESQRKRAKAAYGPQLKTDANLFVWSSETTFGGLAPEGSGDLELPPPTTPYEAIVAGLVSAEPTVIRERVTWDVSVTLAQPLSSLYAIAYAVKAARLAESSADIEIDEAKRAQVREAIIAYFRVLQTKANLETATLAVEQLEAQAKQVEALVETGTIRAGEQLRIGVALAAAKQTLLRSEADYELTQASLALSVNEPAGSRVGAAPWNVKQLPAMPGPLAEAVAEALENRPELERLALAQQQAEIGVLAEKANYLPQLSALAQYKHSEGQGLAGSDDAFVGLNFSWTIFQWGSRKHAVDVASAQQLQLDATLELTKRQLALQVEKSWRDLGTAIASHDVAVAAVEQAEEAYRVAQARFEVGGATATELIDAQTALTESKNNQNSALYQAWVNQADLTYATGRPLQNFGAKQ